MLAAGALLGACEGDNLFSGDGPEFEPRVLAVVLPQSVVADDTIRVRVDATARRSVAQIILSTRGAVAFDTAIDVLPPRQQVSQVVSVGIPALLQDTLLIVSAQIADQAGVLSTVQEVAVPVFGPPVVTSVSGPSAVRPGDQITLRVSAFGARRLTRLDVSARGAFSRDTSVGISPARNSVTQDVVFSIPSSVADTVLLFNVTALDQSGYSSAAASAVVPFAIEPPTVSLLAPASAQAGAPLNLEVNAQAIRQVTELRLELRGGMVRDSVIKISPLRTSVNAIVSVQVPGNIMDPEIHVRAFALDRAGAVSSTPVSIVDVPIDPPMIVDVDAPASVIGGHYLDVRLSAEGVRPIKEMLVRWRGYAVDSLAVSETKITVSPTRLSVVEDVSVQAPCAAEDRVLLMLVTARDEANELSPIATDVVTVLGNPSLCPPPQDTTATPRYGTRRNPGDVLDGTVTRTLEPTTVLYSAPGVRRMPVFGSRTGLRQERRRQAGPRH
jgi:hypothetical protein